MQDESFYRQVLQLREGELLRETGKLSQRKGIGKIKETLRHSSAQVLFACFCFVFFNVQPRRVANFFCSLSGRFKERTVKSTSIFIKSIFTYSLSFALPWICVLAIRKGSSANNRNIFAHLVIVEAERVLRTEE